MHFVLLHILSTFYEKWSTVAIKWDPIWRKIRCSGRWKATRGRVDWWHRRGKKSLENLRDPATLGWVAKSLTDKNPRHVLNKWACVDIVRVNYLLISSISVMHLVTVFLPREKVRSGPNMSVCRVLHVQVYIPAQPCFNQDKLNTVSRLPCGTIVHVSLMCVSVRGKERKAGKSHVVRGLFIRVLLRHSPSIGRRDLGKLPTTTPSTVSFL